MAKPGRREEKPSTDLRWFTDRDESALRVRTEADFPREHALTAANLRRAQQALDELEA